MKYLSYIALSLSLPLFPLAAQAEDILSILDRKSETPSLIAPKTIPYSYTLTLDVKERDGKTLSEGQAVLRIDPTQPPGSRSRIITASDVESEALQNFIKEIEDEDNTMTKQASGFWCGSSDPEDQSDFDPDQFIVLSEDDRQAVLKPDLEKLAELLMNSDADENGDKNDRKMMKRLMKRIEGEVTLAKPSAEMTGFKVRMTRPMTMMLVAKLNQMDVEQNCALAPNGHYHLSHLKMNVAGKAMGSRFGQELDMKVSELTPLP